MSKRVILSQLSRRQWNTKFVVILEYVGYILLLRSAWLDQRVDAQVHSSCHPLESLLPLWLSQEHLLQLDLVRNQICFVCGKSGSGYLLIILRLDKYQTATLKTTSVKQLIVCSILSMLPPYEICETIHVTLQYMFFAPCEYLDRKI